MKLYNLATSPYTPEQFYRTYEPAGITDRLGRQMGFVGFVHRYDFVLSDNGCGSYPFVDEPLPYGAVVQAARNGDRYGASQMTRWFATQAEAETYVRSTIHKRVAALRKKMGAA